MRHIHTSIVSRHLATRGNYKILCTPPPNTSSSEERLPASLVTLLPSSEQTNLPSSNHTYTKSTPKHIHHHYSPSVTSTHTSSLQLHPHTHHIVTPGFVDRSRRSDCTAVQMNGEAGWWTTSGNIGLPHEQWSWEWVDNKKSRLPYITANIPNTPAQANTLQWRHYAQ